MVKERQIQQQRAWQEHQRLQQEQAQGEARARAQREQAEQERARLSAPPPPGFPGSTRGAGVDVPRVSGPATLQTPAHPPGGGLPAAALPPGFAGSPPPPRPSAGTRPPESPPELGRTGAEPAKPAPGTGRGTGLTPGPAVALDPATRVVPRGDRRGYDLSRQGNDGSRTVVTQTTRPDGSRRFTGYRQIEDGRSGTTTRIYADGRRVVWGPDFERRSIGNGVDFVTRHDGRREALLPDGRPVYRDRVTTYRDPVGEQRPLIERTRYVRWWRGRPVFETRPVVRYYDPGFFYGAPVAVYRPQRLAPRYYGVYFSPFVMPVPAMAFGPMDEWVVFASTPRAYSDPVVLMGDMQIWSGFEEGLAYSAPWSGTPLYGSPQAASVRGAVAQMQQQVASQVQGNPGVQQQLGGLDFGAPPGYELPPVPQSPVAVSEEVRLRMREQVRATVVLMQAGTPLTLGAVLAAPDAGAYLFQTAQPLVVTDLSGGGECFLNTGDLIRLAAMPDESSGFATLNVVASGPGSCAPRSVVPVSLSDLQEMLNGFAERLENNLQRVEACTAAGSC